MSLSGSTHGYVQITHTWILCPVRVFQSACSFCTWGWPWEAGGGVTPPFPGRTSKTQASVPFPLVLALHCPLLFAHLWVMLWWVVLSAEWLSGHPRICELLSFSQLPLWFVWGQFLLASGPRRKTVKSQGVSFIPLFSTGVTLEVTFQLPVYPRPPSHFLWVGSEPLLYVWIYWNWRIYFVGSSSHILSWLIQLLTLQSF